MNETAVLPEQSAEIQTPPTTPAEHVETPTPARRPRRFSANLRFNGLRYLTLGIALASTWGLIRGAMWRGTGTPEGTFMLVLAGALLVGAAKIATDILHWAEVNRQAVHVERVHAIHRLFQRACTVREQALIDWRRIHTVLVDNLSGQPQQIRLFHDHDEADRQGEKLLQRALSEEIWIRPEGVDAVRSFKKGVAALDYQAITTEQEFIAAFNAQLDWMRRELALAAIGVPLD